MTKKYNKVKEGITRLFISSLVFQEEISKVGYRAIRKHWGIEVLHHILDVDFGQDQMQIKNRNLAKNMALLNRIALNGLQLVRPSYSKKKETISIKRLMGKMERNPDRAFEAVCKDLVSFK